jgi:hypothetical protein
MLWKIFQLAVFVYVDVDLSDPAASPRVENPAAAIIAFGAAFYATGVMNLLIALASRPARWIKQRLQKIRAPG